MAKYLWLEDINLIHLSGPFVAAFVAAFIAAFVTALIGVVVGPGPAVLSRQCGATRESDVCCIEKRIRGRTRRRLPKLDEGKEVNKPFISVSLPLD